MELSFPTGATMLRKCPRLTSSNIMRAFTLASAMIAGASTLPTMAQHQQQHHTSTTNTKSRTQQPQQHLSPALNQNQMSNMLDDVAVGKTPTLPVRSTQQRTPQLQARGVSGLRPQMGNIARPTAIVRPPAGGMLRGSGMGQSMGMSHGMNMAHGMGMARGVGMGAMGHSAMQMGTMGGGAGMGQHSGMNGAGAASFMQAFKQKFGALMPAEGAGGGGEEGGGESGESSGMAGGIPGMPGGMPGGGGGMQAQLMQRLFQGQAPGGAGGHGGSMGGMPAAGMGATGRMGAMPGGMGGMPISRPSARGLGMGMSSMPQQSNSNQSDVIKRPPGVTGISGGAPMSSPSRGASSSTVSDLERQMEQQYGH